MSTFGTFLKAAGSIAGAGSMIAVALAASLDLAGTEWGFAGETGRTARFLQFRSENAVAGHAGCNRFTGGYARDGDRLSFRPLATTRMACPGDQSRREREFLTLLADVRSAEAGHLTLVLKDGDGNVLAELVRRDPD